MSIVTTDDRHYSDIADKLREKTGTDTTYKPSEMSDGIDDVYTAGQKSMVDESKLLPTTLSGSCISLDDVSEIPHDVACKVESVNKWPGKSEYVITGNGTLQKPFQKAVSFRSMAFSCELTSENLEYSTTGNLVYLLATYEDESGDIITLCNDRITSGKLTKQVNVEGTKVIKLLSLIVPNRFTSGTVTLSNIMLNEGTTARPYTPYVNPKDVMVTRTGKNLFDVNSSNGYYEYWLKPNTSYTLSTNCPKFTNTTSIYFNGKSSLDHGVCLDKPRTTVTDENGHLFITLRTKPGNYDPLGETYASYELLKSGECWAQLEEGSAVTEYEPYVETQILAPATDGTVEGMTSVSPYMNIFADTEGVNIKATYNKSWGMQTERERFYNAFRQGVITQSISFEWLTLSKESITSIISALSPTVTGQTVTFRKSTKELFIDDEWTELTATKPNWTFALL